MCEVHFKYYLLCVHRRIYARRPARETEERERQSLFRETHKHAEKGRLMDGWVGALCVGERLQR